MSGPIGPQTNIHYLHLPKWNRLFALLYISNLTLFTWHLIWMRIRKVPLQHPWATFLSYKQKMKWPSKPNDQDIQCPITSLIFVIESQTGPQHIFDYTDIIRLWNWKTLSEMKLQKIAWQSHKISEMWWWWFLRSAWKWSSGVKLTPHGAMRVNSPG